MDHFDPLGLGRRKSSLAIAQVFIAVSLLILGTRDPSQAMWTVAMAAVLVTFFSATQDIVIDAYRRESMADDEQGFGASMSILRISIRHSSRIRGRIDSRRLNRVQRRIHLHGCYRARDGRGYAARA